MSDESKPGIGIPVFLLIAGSALLAERLGWIPEDVKWGFPTVLIAFGIAGLFQYFKK